MTQERFQRLYPPARPEPGPALWLLFAGDELLVPAAGPPRLLEGTAERPDAVEVAQPRLLGRLDGLPVLVGVIEGDETPEGLRKLGLRALLAQADAELGTLAGYAAQLVHWERTSHFCPACGQPTRQFDGWGKTCAGCGHARYPQLSPVAIVLIHDGANGLLLTTKPN